MSETTVQSQVFCEKPDIKIYMKSTGEEVFASSIKIDCQGRITSVLVKIPQTEDFPSDSETPSEGSQVPKDEYKEIPVTDLEIYRDFLHVPGVGYLKPGTLVCLDDDRYQRVYKLMIGWYQNVSNQKLYGWYLSIVKTEMNEDALNYMSRLPEDLFLDRSLYTWMIDHLNRITP